MGQNFQICLWSGPSEVTPAPPPPPYDPQTIKPRFYVSPKGTRNKKNEHFTVRLTVRGGGGSATSALIMKKM